MPHLPEVPASSVVVLDRDGTFHPAIAPYFEGRGLATRRAATRPDLHRRLRDGSTRAVILKAEGGRPGAAGLLRETRARTDLPLIMITDERSGEAERIESLELGADDHFDSGVTPGKLLARLRAVLRRQEIGRAARQRHPEGGGYRFGGWRLDRHGRSLTGPDGGTLRLTGAEFRLLSVFLSGPQRLLTREALLAAAGAPEDILDRSIDVQILRLRRKLQARQAAQEIIRTERGLGYVFVLPVDPF
jgi:DNA-binding response OmpR family regulator